MSPSITAHPDAVAVVVTGLVAEEYWATALVAQVIFVPVLARERVLFIVTKETWLDMVIPLEAGGRRRR